MKLKKFIKEYAVWIILLFTLTMTAYYQWQDHHSSAMVDGSDLLADKVQQSPRRLAKVANAQHGLVETHSSQVNASQALFQRHLYVSQVDLFAAPHAPEASSAAVSAPEPVVASPPVAPVETVTPVPTAPPLPFTYVGKLMQDGQLAVFIGMRGQDMLIKKGETIAQTYRIDDISPTQVKMTYLPLQIQQILTLEPLN